MESTVCRLSVEVGIASAETKGGPGSPADPEGAEQTIESKDYVTKKEMADSMDRFERRIEAHLAEQFRTQALAIGSLRAMISNTDALLERVLERLEASADSADDSFRPEEIILARQRQN